MEVQPSYRGGSGAQGEVRYTKPRKSLIDEVLDLIECYQVAMVFFGYYNFDDPESCAYMGHTLTENKRKCRKCYRFLE